jgi:hypothetical protein
VKQLISKDHSFAIEYDELAGILLTSIGQVLLEVYYIYFDHEVKGNYDDSSLKKLNEKVIFEFLRDYDICPTLVSKGIAYKIFLESQES